MKKYKSWGLFSLVAASALIFAGGFALTNATTETYEPEVVKASMETGSKKQVVFNIGTEEGNGVSGWEYTVDNGDGTTSTASYVPYFYAWNEDSDNNVTGDPNASWPGVPMSLEKDDTNTTGNRVCFVTLGASETWTKCIISACLVEGTTATVKGQSNDISFTNYTSTNNEVFISGTVGSSKFNYTDWYQGNKVRSGYYFVGDATTWLASTGILDGFMGTTASTSNPASVTVDITDTGSSATGSGFRIISVTNSCWTWLDPTLADSSLYGNSDYDIYDSEGNCTWTAGYCNRSTTSSDNNFYIWGAVTGHSYEFTYDGTNLYVKRNYGDSFADDVLNVTSAICQGDASGAAGWDTRPSTLENRWSYLYERYTNTLTSAAQTEFLAGTSTSSADALARYDLIVSKYISNAPEETFSFTGNFLDRTISSSAINFLGTEDTAPYVAVFSIVGISVLALGAFMIIKKRKESSIGE